MARSKAEEIKQKVEGWKTDEWLKAEQKVFQDPQVNLQKSIEILDPSEPDDDRYTSDELLRQEQRAEVLAGALETLRQPVGPEKESERQKQLGDRTVELGETRLRIGRLKQGEAFLDIPTDELRERIPQLELEAEDRQVKAEEAGADGKRPKLAAKLEKEAAALSSEWIATKAEVEMREIDQAKVEVARLGTATAERKAAQGQTAGPGSYWNPFMVGPSGDFLPRPQPPRTEADMAEARSQQLTESRSSEEESEVV